VGDARDERQRREKQERRALKKQQKAERRAGRGASPASEAIPKATSGVLARLLHGDPVVMERAVEVGLVRREWLANPTGERLTDATPTEVLERLLERQVEQRPSTLAAFGLSTIQLLASPSQDPGDGGRPEVLTVAFSDLEDFTAFTATEGDEAASRLLAEHQRLIGPIVRSRGGRTVKHLGDGVLLTFPSPEAAVLAGLELVEAQRTPLRLRMGLNLGEVLVTRDQDLVGNVVNVAARVTDEARGGEVLATAAVRDAVGALPGVAFGERRLPALKGIDEAVPVFPVTRLPG
jgi:adenylate cyclase